MPFCLAKCRYCDFHSRPLQPADADRYTAAIVRQLLQLARVEGVSPARLAGILPASGEDGLTSSSDPAHGTHNAGETPASRGEGVSPARLAGILPASDEDGLTSSSDPAHGTHNAGETPASRPLATVFLGGGTPTVLGAERLGAMLHAIAPLCDAHTEISVEANPGAFDEPLARRLIEAGVNRINFGVQSFQPNELSVLGRLHDAQAARDAIGLARRAGFANIGLDLMYGLPGQTLASWLDTLRQAIDLAPDHLSGYALSIEPGTPLHDDWRAGAATEMDETLQRELYYAMIDRAGEAGLAQYEISNFARPGFPCRHNVTYWHNLPYLGLGPAAASYVDGVRRTNRADTASWTAAVLADQPPPADEERLPPRMTMAETLMLGLRLTAGVDRATFAARFGLDVLTAFPHSLPRYIAQGALLLTATHLRLTHWALFGADTILADIVEEGRREQE